ncbi:paraquat-inducible protein A [Roseospira marina]|uniref:Paraquat-inducible protein A n=1 Tax=Roseospira marina TaxID=140057 RepID=A0A5M6I703_9PROT|nr:paraquat-inducible protein A [Roseospira marina]KAA5604051.1 paraquat-inducible protein A [Roseospira marina]MBB4315845.1 paraquat-inducible protein A [Roseospira marina]MBB5089015.1 paraquat-inducible protein A [Roseospira marina]
MTPVAAEGDGTEADLAACPECDELHVRRAVRPGERARCTRCGTTLYRRPRRRPDHMLAIVTAALIAFVVANTFPILVLRAQGILSEATLLGSVAALWTEGQEPAAVLVFLTAWLFPLFDLLALFVLLLSVTTGRRPALYAPLLRALQAVRPWGMIEVLMLGVLVSLIKLSRMADVVPGVALWAFIALTVLLAAILSYDLRVLWRPVPHQEAAR